MLICACLFLGGRGEWGREGSEGGGGGVRCELCHVPFGGGGMYVL